VYVQTGWFGCKTAYAFTFANSFLDYHGTSNLNFIVVTWKTAMFFALLLLYYVFYLRFSKHVLYAQRISVINEKVLCAWFSSFVSSLLDSFHLLFPFVFVSSTFSYYRYVSCFITAPMRLLMIHAVYFCDHNSVVNCGIIVNFLYVFFFFFYIILWGFVCLRSNTSQCYFTLLMSRIISVTYEWINWIH